MNDRRIDNLLKLAGEAAEFEQSVRAPNAAGPSLRLTEASAEERAALMGSNDTSVALAASLRNRPIAGPRFWGLAGAALAACMAIGWFIAPTFRAPQPPSSDGAIADASARSTVNPKRSPGMSLAERSLSRAWLPRSTTAFASGQPAMIPALSGNKSAVLVAIFKDSTGDCRCVQIQPHNWEDGRTLADHLPSDLLGVKLNGSCSAGGDSLMLVAMEGPTELLPSTAAQAEELANCVSDAPRICDGSPGCMASMASRCLPPDVAVLAHSVPLASR